MLTESSDVKSKQSSLVPFETLHVTQRLLGESDVLMSPITMEVLSSVESSNTHFISLSVVVMVLPLLAENVNVMRVNRQMTNSNCHSIIPAGSSFTLSCRRAASKIKFPMNEKCG